MTYKLVFDRRALNGWEKLGHTVQLAKRLHDPHIPSTRLNDRIKLRSFGYRLVYEVIDNQILCRRKQAKRQ